MQMLWPVSFQKPLLSHCRFKQSLSLPSHLLLTLGLFELRFRLGRLALRLQDTGEIGVEARFVGIEFDGRPIFGDRVVGLALTGQSQAQIGVGRCSV